MTDTTEESKNRESIFNDFSGAKIVFEAGSMMHGGDQIFNNCTFGANGVARPQPEDPELVRQLMPMFGNDDNEVGKFLASIKGKDGTEITKLVKYLVEKNVICAESKGRDLWTVLHDNGLYSRSESTWNSQL